jgi:dolichol-phosphate mannosyltransferase
MWAILPAFNEAEALPPLLRAFERVAAGCEGAVPDPPVPLRVVVVDDGSTDGTGTAARAFAGRLDLTVLSHGENRGLAAAIRTGLHHVCGLAGPGDIVVTMDADNTHNPGQIPFMVEAVRAGADIVIASRFAPGAAQCGVPPFRQLLSLGVGVLLRLRFGLAGVRDYTCGYRAYRADLLQRAMARYGERLLDSDGFVVTSELLMRLAVFRPRVAEVPIDLHYERKVGLSKLRTGKTVATYLRLIMKRSPL